jgi:xylan 1,4-beta-xylosidase
MFGMMKGKRVDVQSAGMYPLRTMVDSSVRRATDLGALASKDKKSAAVMVWNYHDDDVQSAASEIELSIAALPAKKVVLTHYRIDGEHSNSYEVWKGMGSPQSPTKEQIETLEKAGQLQMIGKPVILNVSGGVGLIKFNLPRQGVSLVKLDW